MNAPLTSAPAPVRPSGAAPRDTLWRVVRTFRTEFAWTGVFSFFANLLLLAPTLYMLQVFDRVMISRSDLTLVALTLITTLLFCTMSFAEWVRSRLLVRLSVRFDERLNGRVFRAAFNSQLREAPGKAAQAFQDLTQLRQFVTGNGVFAFFDAPWAVIYIGVLFMMHPVLGGFALGFSALLAALGWAGNRLAAKRVERAGEAAVATGGWMSAKLRNAEVVEAMGMLGDLRRHWRTLHDRQRHLAADAADLGHRLQAFNKFVRYTQQSLTLGLGAWLAIHGEISAGAMIASNALMSNALRPIDLIGSTWKQFVEARLAWRRLDELLDTHGANEGEEPCAEDPAPLRGEVELRGLVAKARGRTTPILQGLDASFRAGEVVGIIGPSGAGKSTLARALLGIWPHVEGQVLLDGRPVEAWPREALGPQVGYLPQDIEIFDGTIAENIARYGQVDSAAVVLAAKRTGIHDMVLRFPRGYDTPMGEAGALMSGGQRQRVGLARALYGEPKLVVLDEPNAHLDDAGEAALVQAVRDLKAAGSTVFMIVHQKALLAVADRVLVLEAGRIAKLAQVVVQPAPAPAAAARPAEQADAAALPAPTVA